MKKVLTKAPKYDIIIIEREVITMIKTRFFYSYLGGNGWWQEEFCESQILNVCNKIFNDFGLSDFSIEVCFYDDNDFCLGRQIILYGNSGYSKEKLLKNLKSTPYEKIHKIIEEFLKKS